MHGNPGYDIGHLLAGGVLLMSFALLVQRRIRALIRLYAAQAVLLAAAAAWQGLVQHAPELYVAAAITLAAKGVAIPAALRRIVRRLGPATARTGPGPVVVAGRFTLLAAGVGLVALSALVVLPATALSPVAARENLAMALAVVLIGLLAMIVRRTALTQAIGFLALENGLVLAAVGVAGMPLMVELAVAVLVLVAFAVFGVFFFRIRARFDSLELHHLDRVGGAHR